MSNETTCNCIHAGWLGLENYLNENDFRRLPVHLIGNCGYGDTLSIKIVLPTFCQAKCKFCFNRYTAETQSHSWQNFFWNLEKTLNGVFEHARNRKISIDITGGEPTFDPKLFEEFLYKLDDTIAIFHEDHLTTDRPWIDKVVLTTNGYRLEECMESKEFRRMIDIVNISVHHHDYLKRQEIFGTKIIPSNGDLFRICEKLHDMRKHVTAVAVVWDGEFKSGEDFSNFVTDFSKEMTVLGFENCRIRLDYMDEAANEDLFDTKFIHEGLFVTGALKTKYIPEGVLACPVNIYKGVPNISKYVVGPELVIDDNGGLYLDYIKEKPIKAHEVGLIADFVFVKIE